MRVVAELRRLRADDRGLRVDLGLGDLRLALIGLELLAAHQPFAKESGRALGILLGQAQARLSLRLGGHLVRQIGLLAAGIDLHQQVTLLHDLPGLHSYGGDHAAHLRVDRDLLAGDELRQVVR